MSAHPQLQRQLAPVRHALSWVEMRLRGCRTPIGVQCFEERSQRGGTAWMLTIPGCTDSLGMMPEEFQTALHMLQVSAPLLLLNVQVAQAHCEVASLPPLALASLLSIAAEVGAGVAHAAHAFEVLSL